MLVAHQSDHITHAVIGGKKTINFGISDDPAFFQILSSALYKNPVLAMIRETICNAWDAHIDSGRTDRPILITLDDDHLIISDHGNGIPDAMIGPIYGVYGASTKKNDGRQTGGFGLGCKSPFAYTDHFEVTSCHAGTKTIYNMSKSSAQVQGKPSIVPIASFPTTESGITVKIPLDNTKNNHGLDDLVRQVVFNGDIKAMFNGELLSTIGLESSECGMVLLNDSFLTNETNHLRDHDIYVRYGNVIYPVEKSQEFGALYGKIRNLLSNHYNCKLVMLAPSDSLSITPSREALTMSDITVGTITNLLTKFLAVFFKNQELMSRHKEMVNEYVDSAVTKELFFQDKLPLGNWCVPGIPNNLSEKILRSTEDFALLEVLLRYSGRRGKLKAKTWFNYISRYFHGLESAPEFNRGLYQTWHRTAKKHLKLLNDPDTHRYNAAKEITIATGWWQKQVLLPLVQRLEQVLPDFNRKAFAYNSPNMLSESYSREKEVRQVGRVVIESHTHNLVHLLKPTIVLSHNNGLVHKRIGYAKRVQENLGTLLKGTYFTYEVSRKKGEAERVLEALSLVEGIEVIDLMTRLPHEQRAYDERQAEIAKARADAAAGRQPKVVIPKKAKPGLVRLDQILVQSKNRIDTKMLPKLTDPEKLTEPEFLVLVSTGQEMRHCSRNLPHEVIFPATMLYGTKGAVTNNEGVYDRWKEKGAVDISQYLLDLNLKDMESLPSLLEFHSMNPEKMETYVNEKADWSVYHRIHPLIKILTQNPEFIHLVPGFKPLSDEDQYRWAIWNNINQCTPYGRKKEISEAQQKAKKIPLKPEIVEFLDKLISNEFLGLIDTNETVKLIQKHKANPTMQAKILSFITTVLS